MVTVVGAGFAGSECAWALASRGVAVKLVEMRPVRMTPAHQTDRFAELVCSNSFKSNDPDSPPGLLKAEMLALGSLMLPVAAKHAVPGGSALAVNRDDFSAEMTTSLLAHPLVSVVREEYLAAEAEAALAGGEYVVIATGPLTSPDLASWLASKTGPLHRVGTTKEAMTI